MKYGTEYRLEWITMPVVDDTGEVIASQTVRVSIFDTLDLIDDSATATVIPLQSKGNPLKISVINNDRDKFAPIRSLQAVIEFISDRFAYKDVTTFTDSADNRWKVEIYTNPDTDNVAVFIGFLMLPDSSMPFQPDPNIVVLTASDHLGSLKGLPLTTDSGENPSGKYKIGELIALCLKKTGLNLDIKVINNLRHGSGQQAISAQFVAAQQYFIVANTDAAFFYVGQQITVTGTASNNATFIIDDIATTIVTLVHVTTAVVDEGPVTATFTDPSSSGHMYDKVYLDALSFEATIGESIDCYTVLEKILGEYCFACQWKGFWYIAAIDEYVDRPFYTATFDADGVYQSIDAGTTIEQLIGRGENIKFARADAILQFDRPHEHIEITEDYETPREAICNIDFSRGDITTDPDVQVSGYTSFDLECWTVRKLWGSAITTPDIEAAILRSYNSFGDEATRFAMLTKPAGNTGAFNYILPSAVPVAYLDKFTFSFDVSAMTNPAGDGIVQVCFVLLYGIDGRVYILNPTDTSFTWLNDEEQPPLKWHITDAQVSLFRTGLNWALHDSGTNVTVKTDWQNCTIESPAVPVSGELRFCLFAGSQTTGGYDDFQIRYQSVRFDYHPYIGGSYAKYIGQSDKVKRSSPDGYFAKREKSNYIFDSPKPLFKRAMFIKVDSAYVLTSRWYTANTFSLGYPPDSTYLHPYGYTQSYAVWNQYVGANRIFTGSALGLGVDFPWLVARYLLTDTNPNTNNRYFLLASFEQDWKLGTWTGVFIEVYKTDIGHVYSDPHTFKYITG